MLQPQRFFADGLRTPVQRLGLSIFYPLFQIVAYPAQQKAFLCRLHAEGMDEASTGQRMGEETITGGPVLKLLYIRKARIEGTHRSLRPSLLIFLAQAIAHDLLHQ